MTERALHIYGCLSILKLNCVFMKCSNPFGQHSSGDLLSVDCSVYFADDARVLFIVFYQNDARVDSGS